MKTRVDEIADRIYRLSTFVPDIGPTGFTFNQFLIDADEPTIFHTGPRAMFPVVSEAVSSVLALERLRWIMFGHLEADECGAMNLFLEAAPNARVAHTAVGCMTSINDLADRPPEPIPNEGTVDLGGKSIRSIDTPHVPHGWDAHVIYEETTGTLLCGDILTQVGDGPALTDDDLISAAGHAEDMFGATCLTPQTEPTIRRLADLSPTTLAIMHGSSYNGDARSARFMRSPTTTSAGLADQSEELGSNARAETARPGILKRSPSGYKQEVSLTRFVGRGMLSTVSVLEGIETFRNPGPQVKASEDLVARAGWKVDPELVVKINGAVQVAGGILLAMGKARRLSALALIGSTVATTYAGNRFWTVDDPDERAGQRANFLKNLGLMGGLILEVVDTEGAPSLGWRARRAAEHTREVMSIGSQSAVTNVSPVTRRVSRSAARVAAAQRAGSRAGIMAAGHALDTTNDRLKRASRGADRIGVRAAHDARQLAASTSQRAGEVWPEHLEWPAEALNAGARQAAHLFDAGSDRGGELLSVGAQKAEATLRNAIDRIAAT